jgi:tetratricopeptide (TPR) repeat protein
MGVRKQQTDFYAVLGLPRDANRHAIEKAYYLLHREHPPQKDPDGYARIRQAFETLYDPKARIYYDQLWKFGDHVQSLMSQALGAMEDGNCLGASRHLKRVIVAADGADEARDLLGICQLDIGLTDEALETYRELTERRPDVPLYWIRYGDAFLVKAEKLSEQDRRPLIGSARYNYRKAIKLDPKDTSPYLAIARTYLEEEKEEQALSWAEKAVSAHRSVDIQNLDALFFMCHVHANAGHVGKVVDCAKRIESVIPNDTEMKLYAACMFARIGMELLDNKAYESANYYLKVATRFDPKNQDLQEMQEKAMWMVEADQVWPRLEADGSVIHPIKALAALTYVHFSDQEIDGGFNQASEAIRKKLENYPADQVRRSIEILITEYPQYQRFRPKMWGRMLAKAREASGLKPSYTGKSAPDFAESSTGSRTSSGRVEIPVKQAGPDWPLILGGGGAILFAVIGYFVVPIGALGAAAGMILGWVIGSAIGRML